MTIRETYTGLFNQQDLFSTFSFLASNPVVKIDKKHNQIIFTDPAHSQNKVVIDTEDLEIQNGQITAGIITEYHLLSKGKDAVSVTGLDLDATGLQPAMMTGASGLYEYVAGNAHGTLVAKGDKYDNFLEIGQGGKATVDAGAGNDLVEIWHSKNAVIDGGAGVDTIEFSSYAGTPPIADGVAKIDLATGKGTNPYGGALTVKNIENITNMFNGSNDFRGDAHDNIFHGGSHADTLMGRAGDDQIYLRPIFTPDPRATLADGGAGKDTLFADLSEGVGTPFTGSGDDIRFHNKLDLMNPDDNLGTFHGGTFKNFEVFRVNGFLNKDVFDFSGSNASEQVFSAGSDDPLNGRGGNDLLSGGLGADILTGGAGADKFQYSQTLDSTANPATRDTIADFSHTQHDKIDLHLIDADTTGGQNDKFDFNGTKAFDGHAGELYWEKVGSDTFVYADTNGDKAADMVILLDGGPKLAASDFIL